MKTKIAIFILLLSLECFINAAPITFEEVLLLVRMNETESFISQEVIKRHLLHPLTPEQEVTLQAQGAKNTLIKTLQNPIVYLSETDAAEFVALQERQKIRIYEAKVAKTLRLKAQGEEFLRRMDALAQATPTPSPAEPEESQDQVLASADYPVSPENNRIVRRIPYLKPTSLPGESASSNFNQTVIARPDFLGGSRITDNFGHTVRVTPDFLGGFRATNDRGDVTRFRQDFLGGYRGTDDSGNTTRIRPDFLGGFRASDDYGNLTRFRSDFLGGFRGTDYNGNTIQIRKGF